ncbi:hypothetical protein D9613_002522 [Agrocybe pediades]|uniref:F-box domain-containing protein n=1 Tax=Agrocybe pediades TaxID=84607 RepID=A0A8H4QQ91_9AGAR|nr:hypothetical protein D9613_002522 [Agrocybe pediades]
MHLNDDLLLLIFNTISTDRNVDIGRRQATIRYASQVCQRWRDLILPASYVWGRLVWVNRNQDFHWMKEVFERAKTASLLSVRLHGQRGSWQEEKDRPFNSLAITVLQNVWHRLEDVHISYRTDLYSRSGREFHDYLWEQIRNPAPSLRSIVIHDLNPFMTNPLPVDTFNGSAPLLQELSCIRATIPSPNPWLSRITTLVFTPQSLEDIINAVSWAHDLKVLRLGEHLDDRAFFRPEDQGRLKLMSPIILPRLARIGGLSLSFEAFTALWSSRFMSPAESYSNISISIHETHVKEGQDPGPSQFLTALSNFFYHHSGITTSNIHNHGVQWYLEADYNVLVIEVSTLSDPELYMKLSFDWGEDGNYREITPFIARAITEYAMCTKHFQLRFVGNMKGYIRNQVFDSLLLSMEDVESITVGYTSLQYYDELEKREGRELFTKLRTVYFAPAHGMYDRLLDEVKAFLMRRVEAGRPVSTIQFSDPNEDKSKILRALQEVSGLRITWGK